MKSICIGIHVHEQPQQLQATIESVRRNTPAGVELLLLPDGPDAQVRQALRSWAEIPQLGTDKPCGTAACFNRLAANTDADLLVLLESGSRVAPQWLDHLIAALDANPANGLAGPSTNQCWNEQGAFAGGG